MSKFAFALLLAASTLGLWLVFSVLLVAAFRLTERLADRRIAPPRADTERVDTVRIAAPRVDVLDPDSVQRWMHHTDAATRGPRGGALQ